MTKLSFLERNYYTTKPKYLVILLHGYGSNGSNLLELSQYFEKFIPESKFIAPNAIEPWEGGFFDSYQWFSLAKWGSERDVKIIKDEIIKANETLKSFILDQIKLNNIEEKNLFLIGFSQGAMMAMYQGFIMPKKIAGVISYSGKLILPEYIEEKITNKPDICLIHGKRDSILPFYNFEEASNELLRINNPFSSIAFDDLDHSINLDAIKAGINFINKQLKNY